MIKKRAVIFLFFISTIIFILSINFLSASFVVGSPSHNITTSYSAGDPISGWISMSFNKQSSESMFTANTGNYSVSLIDLINTQTDYSYVCVPSDCQNTYSETSSASSTKSVSGTGETVLGFKLTGTGFQDIQGFSFDATSNAAESNIEQLSIDILNDGKIDWVSSAPSGNFQAENFGCYLAPPDSSTPITTDEYCNKITIPVSPNVVLGANIIANAGSAETTFTLNIKDAQGNSGTCQIQSAGGEISCIAKKSDGSDFSVTEKKEFSVCIKGPNDNTHFSISYEQQAPICGSANGIPFDFNIYASAGTFAALGNFIVNDINTPGIKTEITNYIKSRYGTDCSQGCYIPVKFNSKINQNIGLSNANIAYRAGVLKTTTDFFSLTKSPALISANMQKLYLDLTGFSAPSKSGELNLSFNGSKVFSDYLTIEEATSISLSPEITIAEYPTNFTIRFENFSAGNKSTSYRWDFGDGSVETSSGKSIIHTYHTVETFPLKVEVISGNKTTSKTFNVQVQSPKIGVNIILSEKLRNLASIKAGIGGLSSFYQDLIKTTIDLKSLEDKLKEIQVMNDTASSDEDYIAIMAQLAQIDIPVSLRTTAIAQDFSFYPDENKIDVDVLKSIKQPGKSGTNEEIINSIFAWNSENMNTQFSLEKISGFYEGYSKLMFSVLKIDAKRKTSFDYTPYIVIQKIDDLTFFKDYSEKESSGYYYIPLPDAENEIIFAIKENIDIASLPFFISPEIDRLSLINILPPERPKTGALILSLIILFLFGIGMYFLMGWWYDKKYEDFLFKNKNDLYNIVSYVQASKKAGITDSDIADKLKKSGWKAEQVTYVMRKYVGKRTGIPGLDKFFNMLRNRKIAKLTSAKTGKNKAK